MEISVQPDSVWRLRSPDPRAVQRLVSELGCSWRLAAILVNRGIVEPEEAEQFLQPGAGDFVPPDTLPDLPRAVSRLNRALRRGEEIVVYADRDVDGVSGCAILDILLCELGGNVTTYVPGKWDGYGLNADAVEDVADRGVDLLLTVDCGTTAISTIEQAERHDIDVIVTDHHQPEDRLPPAIACVNPRRGDSEYPHESLAGGTVAMKLGQALVESRERQLGAYYRYALPLALLATLGDYVPLSTENRAIVREGYERLSDCGLPGLVTLADYLGIDSIRDVSWSLVPLLNAGQEAESGSPALDLLRETDDDRIATILSRLETYREERREQRIERQAHLDACFDRQCDPEEDVVFTIETDRYVGGGALSRLSERWGRPVIAYRERDGLYRGGGRSTVDVNLLELYGESERLLEEYWGHPGAAGFRISPDNWDRFEQSIEQTIHDTVKPELLRPSVEIDWVLEPAESRSLLDEIDRLRPFGNENEAPTVLVRSLALSGIERFGAQERHVKLLLSRTDAMSVIDWNGGSHLTDLDLPTTVDIVGTIRMDAYERKPSLDVVDWRPSNTAR